MIGHLKGVSTPTPFIPALNPAHGVGQKQGMLKGNFIFCLIAGAFYLLPGFICSKHPDTFDEEKFPKYIPGCFLGPVYHSKKFWTHLIWYYPTSPIAGENRLYSKGRVIIKIIRAVGRIIRDSMIWEGIIWGGKKATESKDGPLPELPKDEDPAKPPEQTPPSETPPQNEPPSPPENNG